MIRSTYNKIAIRKEELWLGCLTFTLAAIFIALIWNVGIS